MDEYGLPTGFGKQEVKRPDLTANIANTKRAEPSSTAAVLDLTKPPPEEHPTSNGKGKERAADDDDAEAGPAPAGDADGSDDEGEEDGSSELPVTHEVVLSGHTKAVSALSLDPSGARIVSGGYDYECKLWDFGGMSASFRAFRSWEPKEGHQVRDVHWSNTGDSFICINGSNQPQLYDRDGSQIAEYIKGDMYIRDLRHCAGHIAEIYSAAWHPKDPSTFITASGDSSIRIWDVDNKRKSKNVIVVKSKERGTKTRVTACAYSPDGKTIAGACSDGTLHLWSTSSNFARPNATVEKAHTKDTHTSCVVFSADGKLLVSRGGDDTVKLWDAKNFKKPLAEKKGLVSLNPETNVIFSPDERFILTGVAANKAEGQEGKIVFLRKEDLEVVKTLTISPANVVRVLWHPRINQILTGSSDGSIHVLYSPHSSIRGATLALSRQPRKVRPEEEGSTDVDRPIFTPHALPMFKDNADGEGILASGRGGKRKRERERQDPQKTMKPMPPLTGPGRGGRVGASATQHVVKGLVKDSIRNEDPREALLRFAAEHEGEASKYMKAWEGNAVVMDARLLEDEERAEEEKRKREEERERKRRERPRPLAP